MSGGGGDWSFNYRQLEEVARILHKSRNLKRRALADLVELCAKAVHDVEWCDSGDYGSGQERASIDAALKFCAEKAMIDIVRRDIQFIRDELKELEDSLSV